METRIIRNGKNVLSAQEIGLDEPGGVVRMTLADLIRMYDVNLDILLCDENELMQLADWNASSDEYKDCCVHDAQCIYCAHNGRTKQFRIKYYINSKDTRMYMVTRDLAMSYVTGLVYDMVGNAIDDIDLS